MFVLFNNIETVLVIIICNNLLYTEKKSWQHNVCGTAIRHPFALKTNLDLWIFCKNDKSLII